MFIWAEDNMVDPIPIKKWNPALARLFFRKGDSPYRNYNVE